MYSPNNISDPNKCKPVVLTLKETIIKRFKKNEIIEILKAQKITQKISKDLEEALETKLLEKLKPKEIKNILTQGEITESLEKKLKTELDKYKVVEEALSIFT